MTAQQIKFLPGEPHIMPHQDVAFNGDEEIALEFIKLRDRFQITAAIETGSATGGTTNWLAGNFEKVHSIEINEQYLKFAKHRCAAHTNIKFYHGDSTTMLLDILKTVGNRTIIFLDAHWNEHCPLLSELTAIANSGLRPCILIHDFYVPGSAYSKEDKAAGLGYDSYNGQPFTLEWIKPSLDKIYNEQTLDDRQVPDDYEYYYNDPVTAKGARRGCLYVIPK